MRGPRRGSEEQGIQPLGKLEAWVNDWGCVESVGVVEMDGWNESLMNDF